MIRTARNTVWRAPKARDLARERLYAANVARVRLTMTVIVLVMRLFSSSLGKSVSFHVAM